MCGHFTILLAIQIQYTVLMTDYLSCYQLIVLTFPIMFAAMTAHEDEGHGI